MKTKKQDDTKKQKPPVGFCPICGKELKRFNLKFTEDGNRVNWLQGECEECGIPFTAGEPETVRVEHSCELVEWRQRLQEAERQLLFREIDYLRSGGTGVWHIGVRDGLYLADDLMMNPSAKITDLLNQCGHTNKEDKNDKDNSDR